MSRCTRTAEVLVNIAEQPSSLTPTFSQRRTASNRKHFYDVGDDDGGGDDDDDHGGDDDDDNHDP